MRLNSNDALTSESVGFVMRFFAFTLLSFLLLYACPAFSGPFEAREVARMGNCTPKKIEVVSNNLNQSSQTIYRIECNMPKVRADGVPNQSEAVLVRCTGAICDLLRAVPKNEK